MSLAVLGSELYVGGEFSSAGGKISPRLALWHTRTSAAQSQETALPTQSRLSAAYPMPFSSEVRIPVTLTAPQRIQVMVYDLLGQQVRTLLQGHLEVGQTSVVWDGKNDAGNELPNGVYWVRLLTPTSSHTKQVIRIR
ncbi:MAG: T9SS type A sorting domain-containing protein [Bacteroidetes Order II. Incertae sedis bacterium]|nr:T9SS type A sorting domain-containing protein [Bacteroidetes Order II. bacterium]